MGSEANLKSRVSDKLISQPTVIRNIIGLSKQASFCGAATIYSDSKTLVSNKKRFRLKTSNPDEGDEVTPSREKGRQVKIKYFHAKEDDDDSELTELKLTKKEEEEAIQRSNALEKDNTEVLRKVSRQEYLKKREEKKLEELRDELEDEQYLFDGEQLTEAERREFRYKKEIFELVSKRTGEDASEISEEEILMMESRLQDA